MNKKFNTQIFIDKSKEIHGDKYDYSQVDYKNARTKIKITCKEHGEFKQLPNNHTRGVGCPKCVYNKIDNTNILYQFKKIHKNKYDYSQVKYKGDKIKVKIICRKHGVFEQTPSNHKMGRGCKKCSGRGLNNEELVEIFKARHGNKYDYSLIDYKNNSTKVKIICQEHGVFKQTPNNHKKGSGCIKCSGLEKLNNEIIKKQFKLIHDNKYDYSLINYINSSTLVDIICPIHGLFKQTPNNHKNGNGCPTCKESSGERKIRLFLINKKIKFIPQYKFDDCINLLPLPFDFFLPDYNICIEYNGMQHYKPIKHFGGKTALKQTQKRDRIKNEYCKLNDIRLIVIKYNEDIESKMNTIKW